MGRSFVQSMRFVLERTLLRNWNRRGALAIALWPIAALLLVMSALRRKLFSAGIFKVRRVDAMVIVVGNVITGGAGKTPTVMSLVRHLQQHNMQVGVISRGYGRQNRATLEVMPDSTVSDAGDEPLLVRRSTQVPVWVGASRFDAASAMLAKYPAIQIIICDDGLQHYGLYRDLEICVFDNRGYGNGWTLPAGPLREAWPRWALPQAGQAAERLLVLHTGDKPAFSGFRAERHLADFALRSDGSSVPLASLQPFARNGENDGNTERHGKPLMAAAGIAQPAVFFDMLRAGGLVLSKTLALPDHYDFNSYPRNLYQGYELICTEKDAVKLWKAAPNALAVPLVQTAEPAFWQAVDARVKTSVQPPLSTKLSFPHGHKTT